MKFSSRLPDVLDDNALARAVAARRAVKKPIYDLTLSNPTQAGFNYPTKEIAAALAKGAATFYQPEPRGLLSARKAIVQYYRGRGPDAVDPAQLHLTASTSEAYGFLLKLLGEPGAEILAPSPSYPLIEHLASLEGWRTKPYPLVWEGRPPCRPSEFDNQKRTTRRSSLQAETSGWRMDFATLTAAITPATRAIAIIHPHNPTGWMVRSPDAHFLLETCEKHNLALIVDEVFLDYIAAGNKAITQSFAAHKVSAITFTLGGLSKSCAMPQFKLGWIHMGGPAEQVASAQARLDFITDAYLSVATPVQAALPKLFQSGKKIRAQIQKRLAKNYATLTSLDWPDGFSILPYTSGWSALLRRPSASDEEKLTLKLLDRAGVLAHPGYFFDFPENNWHVISLLPEPKEFRQGVQALHEWLPKLV